MKSSPQAATAVPPFDPSYGYGKADLLAVEPPAEPADFAANWKMWRREALEISPLPELRDTGKDRAHWRVFEFQFHSTGDARIAGWLLLPKSGEIRRGFVVGHGYGGREAPDIHLPFPDAALMFPCARGISLSRHPKISSDPAFHVLHDIQKKDRYVLRGCVEDQWLAVSCLLRWFPQLEGHLGYLGISFGGGVGILSMAWEERVRKVHVNVPSFGHQERRLELPSQGSAAAVQAFDRKYPGVAGRTLAYFDAATAARYLRQPVHCACALADPFVAPPGQFAIHNAIPGEKQLFVLEAGHMEYPEAFAQETQLLQELDRFFSDL